MPEGKALRGVREHDRYAGALGILPPGLGKILRADALQSTNLSDMLSALRLALVQAAFRCWRRRCARVSEYDRVVMGDEEFAWDSALRKAGGMRGARPIPAPADGRRRSSRLAVPRRVADGRLIGRDANLLLDAVDIWANLQRERPPARVGVG